MTVTPFPISQLIEDTIVARLEDQYTGLVPMMKELVALGTYGALPAIDFTQQLYRAQIDAASYWQFENPEPIALFVHVDRTADQHRLMNQDFSGTIQAGLDVMLTTADPEVPAQLQQMANLFNDAIYFVFGVEYSRLLAPILFNGGIQAQRSRPTKGGQNWYQVLNYTFPFGLN